MDPLYIVLITFLLVVGAFGVSLLYFKSKSLTNEPTGGNVLAESLQQQLIEVKNKNNALEAQLSQAVQKAAGLEASLAAAETAKNKAEENRVQDLAQARAAAVADLEKAEQRFQKALDAMKETFEKTSQDVLKGMTPDVTKEVASKVDPLISQIQTTLNEYRKTINDKFTTQDQSLNRVNEQMDLLKKSSETLAKNTESFTAVLKSSSHRGKWGEVTLRRVVEAAGLSPHCDFAEQVKQDDSRPDLIIKLPGNRCIIVDSKVPEFDRPETDTTEQNRQEFVQAHAKKLKDTIRDLAKRDYPAVMAKNGQLVPFNQVILFLPAESLLSAALEGNPDLILEAQKEKILLATPATLIGFLGAIHLAWQQNQQAENAAAIAEETNELFKRVAKFVEYIVKIRKELDGATKAMNDAIGSYEGRVLPQGEKLKKLGVAPQVDPLPSIAPLENTLRELKQ